ncbi:uncharacterized protein LOC120350522 isoform X2 [Nilaparvata lugens]|uniref:uncharacterized protein LOC120350522 isoform X2 n=1 Tax=Nilaparvata lugens TaxID=108931 RepID=UPI00193D6D88|nr:uncharacterized protein LOC120350522 isoform X2 [Nilaparvata lugens]
MKVKWTSYINLEEGVWRTLLVWLTTNEAATNFSWEGGKGKKSLNSLLMNEILEKVVAVSLDGDFTSKLFETRVKEWLRQPGPECNLLKTSKIIELTKIYLSRFMRL